MSDLKCLEDVYGCKGNRIITKRIEPYDVIESAKKFYDVVDYTFTGRNKFEVLDGFLSALKSLNVAGMGLYMKNVNKFYLLSVKENPENKSDIELLHTLLIKNEYGFTDDEQINQAGIEYNSDVEYALEQIDMGKAEASFILL